MTWKKKYVGKAQNIWIVNNIHKIITKFLRIENKIVLIRKFPMKMDVWQRLMNVYFPDRILTWEYFLLHHSQHGDSVGRQTWPAKPTGEQAAKQKYWYDHDQFNFHVILQVYSTPETKCNQFRTVFTNDCVDKQADMPAHMNTQTYCIR